MDGNQYPDEQRYLAETVEFIDREVLRLKSPSFATVPYRDTAREIQRMDTAKIERYQRLRPQPYFGRLVFVPEDGGKPTDAYIGKGGHVGDSRRDYVYDWTQPFPAQLFYAADPRQVSYNAPKGEVRGSITLKRQYTIENDQLLDVEDSTERFMIQQLSQGRGLGLRNIVATIQPKQYQQIAAAPERVMVVQGVAGSGKSEVGLHRIAYLLSPFNGLTDGITASRVVFFGPTRSFLRYVANLLPSLNVRDVHPRTVRDWLTDTLSTRVLLDRGEPLLEKLLRDRGKKWQAANQAARLKGSLQMSRTLERHVQTQRKQFVASAAALAVQLYSATPIVLDATRVRRVVRAVPSGHLNTQRGQLIERLVEALWQNAASGIRTPRNTRLEFREFAERVRPRVEQQVAMFWPKLDFRQEYRRLLSNASALAKASSGRMGEQESAMLSASLPRRPNVFQPEDLGPLCYLDHLLNERPNAGFEHVVLDEAQEVSQIELLLMQRHSRGSGFTILGDLTQSLTPQGIERWREVLQLFHGATVSRYVARTSYRSTYEITRYANRIMKKAAPNALTAVPYQRHGSPPSFTASPNYNEMVAAIAADLRGLRGQGAKTIGVLCKSAFDTQKLYRALRSIGIEDVGMLDREGAPSESAIVAPIYLTRGLEYDAVILAGASKDNYLATPLHSKLLYLAVSRAAHQLHIHWVGQPAPQLGVPRRASSTKKSGSKRKTQQTL